MSKRGLVVGLQGRRPEPLSLPGTTTTTTSPPRPAAKRARGSDDDGGGDATGAPAPAAYDGPVIVYEHTPKVVHVRPYEFKALVQRLTGRQRSGDDQEPAARVPLPPPSAETSSSSEETAAAGGRGGDDPLVLTLGKKQAPPLFDDGGDHMPALLLPSPGSILSPGPFLFSPATMQAIRELIS